MSFVFEKDLFYDTDRNYTDGVRASWLSSRGATTARALNAARWFPLFPEGGIVRTTYAIGQNIYTPQGPKCAGSGGRYPSLPGRFSPRLCRRA